MVVQVKRRRFTVQQFHCMSEAGVFTEDDRVELLAGEVIEMPPIGSRHAACVNRLNRLFSQRVGEESLVSVQNPVQLGEFSEPQPDLALLRSRADFYADAHPTVTDILLLIEVADTSVGFDRDVKVSLYARSGVPEVWLVDLTAACVDVYRQPSPEGYLEVRRLQRDQRLMPLSLPDIDLSIEQILQ